MKKKNVEIIVKPREPHFVGDGFRVHNFIPSFPRLEMQRMDPFIMLDYGSKYSFPPSKVPRGVGVHPHRGFETVTIAYKGKISHRDSSGGGGTIGEGDIQWMTAAKGVLHKEYHEDEWSKKGGEFQMVQLWVNLPKEYKMSDPKYQAIKKNQVPSFQLPNHAGKIDVIAGQYKDIYGPADTYTPIHMYNVYLNKEGETVLSFSANYTTALLVIEGSVIVNEEELPENHFALMANDGSDFNIKSTQDSIILVLGGEPIREPIAAHGPFVMNTRDEIAKAFQDFNNGKFGYLE